MLFYVCERQVYPVHMEKHRWERKAGRMHYQIAQFSPWYICHAPNDDDSFCREQQFEDDQKENEYNKNFCL